MTRPPSPNAYSLGEIEAQAKKAARGAGYSWGLAEHAGHVTRQICGLELDGCGALLEVLDTITRNPLSNFAPKRLDGDWAAQNGVLCPISAGACLSDLARALPPLGLGMKQMLEPILILPACADVARASGEPVTLSWSKGIIGIGDDGLAPSAALDKLRLERLIDIHIHPGGMAFPATAAAARAFPDQDVWARLGRYAERTYAPATEASRNSGAGAGLTDND